MYYKIWLADSSSTILAILGLVQGDWMVTTFENQGLLTTALNTTTCTYIPRSIYYFQLS